MIIDNKMLNSLADLSRLQISHSEKEKLSADLNSVLAYFDVLNSIDMIDIQSTDDISPTPLRNDAVSPSCDRTEILQNAPSKSEEMFIIPKAID